MEFLDYTEDKPIKSTWNKPKSTHSNCPICKAPLTHKKDNKFYCPYCGWRE